MLKNMMLMTACASREKGQNTMMFFSTKALDKFHASDDANYDEHAPRDTEISRNSNSAWRVKRDVAVCQLPRCSITLITMT
jgi:hypothetical protein